MNENPKGNNIVNKENNIKKKSLNSNDVNKKIIDKDSKRKQKRLFQMQKRLALFNEEDLSELESENNLKINEDSIEKNNICYNKDFSQIPPKRKSNNDKTNLSFNYYNSHKNNLNIEKIHHKRILEKQNLKKNLEKKFQDKIEQETEIQNIKEEEISFKKKNTNSNTNDEDKTSTEALFPNELDINIKKSKSIFQNDSMEGEVFSKNINGDIDENPNIFSCNNDNNEIDEEIMEKEEIDFQQENLMNIFNFDNLINNDKDNSYKDDNIDNIDNDNSLIINETDENNININNDEENKEINNEEDSNVELNISNLEIDINEINEETNNLNEDELTLSKPTSNEFAKKYLSSKSKSFIKFNNNLTARAAANNLKNSMSYMLALCPELIGGIDKKNLIKENYAATDVISEDIEAENFTPRQSEKINEISIEEKNKNSINTNNYLSNKTLRNQKRKSPVNTISKKEKLSPKTHYKNRSKLDKNTFNDFKDINSDIKNFSKVNKKIFNAKSNSININNNHNNIIYNSYNTNYEKCKNNTIQKAENINTKYRHQKAKSLVNYNQLDSFNSNLNLNIKNKQHSPKGTSNIFNKKNAINKIPHKNIDKKKNKNNVEKDKEIEHSNIKQNYLSNENKKKNNPKYIKKSNSNVYNNNIKKTHNYCKSDIRDKNIDIKKKYTHLRRAEVSDLSKSINFNNKKNNIHNDNNKICFTEKSNKSKDYNNFISHIKKNTPDNVNNISEQNINHSKKLSQQITDGYKFFMNSINNNNHPDTRYNDSKKNTKRKRIASNNFTIKSTPLNNYFTFNKNKTNTISNYNNNVTFIKKNLGIKGERISHIIPNHNKSKTSFITPSYQNNFNKVKNKILKKNYTLINSNKKNKKMNENSSKIIKKNYIKKINNKFNEIKKVVNDSSVKIIHKKINTIGQSNELTKLLSNNSNTRINYKQLKNSSSNSNYQNNFNKHKIIMALQHIKFSPMTNYSKVLNELYKSKKNLFIILVYTDSIKKYIFRGLYEVNSNDQKIANKLFAPGYGQNALNATRLHNFFNYHPNNGEFIRIKFNNESEKKFNSNTIIVY